MIYFLNRISDLLVSDFRLFTDIGLETEERRRLSSFATTFGSRPIEIQINTGANITTKIAPIPETSRFEVFKEAW